MMFVRVAMKFNVSIRELSYLSDALDPPRYRTEAEAREFKERIRSAERDAALLKLKLPVEELLAIRDRAEEGLRWYLATFPPGRRAEEEAKLAVREAELKAVRARNRALAERALAKGRGQ
jgi:hypothetical protein